MIFPDMLIRSVPLNWFCNKFWSNKIQFDTVGICCQYLTSFVMCTQKVFGRQKRCWWFYAKCCNTFDELCFFTKFISNLKDSSYYLWLYNHDLVKACLRRSLHCTLSRTKFIQSRTPRALLSLLTPSTHLDIGLSWFRLPSGTALNRTLCNILFFTTPMIFGLLNSLSSYSFGSSKKKYFCLISILSFL
jgi:hypothetical protein